MSVPWFLMAKGKGGGGYKTASGPIVSVNDALAAPLHSLVANIEPVQDLHGYDNPWPAGGGKNLFDGEFLRGYWAYANGAFTADSKWICTKKIPCKPSTYYTVSADEKMTRWQGFVWYDENGAFISTTNTQTGVAIGYTAESPATAAYLVFDIAGYPSSSSGIAPNDVTHFQIEEGQTATSYAPYSNICPISGWSAVNVWVEPTYDPTENPTATIALGQTVYGGTLDVTNGVLTVDRAMVDLGTLNWISEDQYAAGMARVGEQQILSLGAVYNQIPICSELKGTSPKSYSSVAYGSVCFSNSADTPFIRARSAVLSGMTDAQIKTELTGVQFCYELATPITIPLTATEISTLQGQNNVWADTGDVTVEYLASGGANPDLMKLAVAFMGRMI